MVEPPTPAIVRGEASLTPTKTHKKKGITLTAQGELDVSG